MKTHWRLSARNIAILLVCWLLVTNVLVGLVHVTDWWFFKPFLFGCLTLLPGAALLRVLRIYLRNLITGVLYSFGLSLLVLMLSGLAANHILPLFGVERPLEFMGALSAWNATTGLLIAVAILSNRQGMPLKRWNIEGWSSPAWLLLGFSMLTPFLATAGAFRLNNGGDAFFAIATLCFITVLIVYVILLRRRLPSGLLAWLIFIIGLSVLLMTSLRGWDIVGHDIEGEFRVFTLTHLHAHWDIALDRNPYNACLSITILPEMFARLLDISGLVVFKVILQVIFAACPVVLYLLLQQYISRLGAFIGSLFFICYPTFINDSAMLTRQSVAYLFFALALLMMTNKIQKTRYKLLFLLCALGVILSHYSTAYMFVALFAAAVICKLCIRWCQRHRPPEQLLHRTVLSSLFAALLFLMTYVWYAQVTGTSSGLTETLQKSIANIPSLFSGDENKSSDTSAALFFAGGKTQIGLYESYLASTKPINAPPPVKAEETPHLTDDDLPLTPLGKKAQAIGINPSFITAARQNFARLLQVLALAGVIWVAYQLLRRGSDALSADFVCLSVAGIALLALLVILPVLSINYGILRAFHQALIFLILPIMLILARISKHMWAWLRTTMVAVSMVVLFVMFTGLAAQMLGGVSPHLSMNNRGVYYGLYYATEADARAFQWLKTHVPQKNDVRAANFNKAFMHDPDFPFSATGILPSQINADTYLYLDQAQVLRQKMYAHHESSPLIVSFPLGYYGRVKDQIYSTTSTGVFR